MIGKIVKIDAEVPRSGAYPETVQKEEITPRDAARILADLKARKVALDNIVKAGDYKVNGLGETEINSLQKSLASAIDDLEHLMNDPELDADYE